MAIVSYDPWAAMTQLQEEMNRAFKRVGTGDDDNGRVVTSDWAPAVDIEEREDSFVLHADIPGVDPKAIEVSMEDGVLTIRGDRDSVKEEDKDGFKRVERVHGSFYRRFALPDTADAEKISARGEHGVLTISIPKMEKVQPRRITVQA